MKLLKSDPRVLEYFQSLQANLEADVQIWKARAKKYQQQYEQLQSQRKEQKQQSSPSTRNQDMKTTDSRTTHHSKNGEDAEIEPTPADNGHSGDDGGDGVPIDDSMLNFDSDDSSDPNGANKEHEPPYGQQEDESTAKGQPQSSKPVDDQKDLPNKADSDLEKHMNAVFDLDSSSDDDSNEENDPKQSAVLPQQSETTNTRKETQRHTPGLFVLESSSDDDDDDVENMKKSDKGNPSRKHAATTERERSEEEQPNVLELLREAFQSIERLDVSLVEEKASTTTVEKVAEGVDVADKAVLPAETVVNVDPTDENSASNHQEPDNDPQTWKWISRADEEVAADLAWAIHSLSRIQLIDKDLLESYPPFVTSALIPACNFINTSSESTVHPENPIVEGKLMVFRALLIIDTYCGEEAFLNKAVGRNEDDQTTKMMVGLRGRKQLVESLMSSLDGEITQCWPVQDRADSVNTLAYHHSITVEDEDQEEMDTTNPDHLKDSDHLDAKVQGRLSSLLERVVLVQLVVGYYISRDQNQVGDLVWGYLLSTAPSQHDDHPKLPPTMSLILVEAMLIPQPKMLWWLPPTNDDGAGSNLLSMLFYGEDRTSVNNEFAEKALKLCLELVASIWRHRYSNARNARVRDIARVEVAAYRRLVEAGILQDHEELKIEDYQNRASALLREIKSLNWITANEAKCSRPATLAFQLCLIMGHEGASSLLLDSALAYERASELVWRANAVREMEIRRLDRLRTLMGSEAAMSTPFQYFLDKARGVIAQDDSSLELESVSHLLHVAVIVANGELALACASKLLKLVDSRPDTSHSLRSRSLSRMGELSHTPVVRVINLQCRPDRMEAFYVQAMIHRVTVVHAVASLKQHGKDEASSQKEPNFFGQYAFDGRGKWFEATEQLSKQVGDGLDDLVHTHWRPHDLKAFDTNAPDGEGLVRASPSERACALSHLASWKGALRSFQSIHERTTGSPSPFVRRPTVLRRLFHMSGFAQGTAMHVSNRQNPPAPVCLIVEDDAMLVDRFTDRLQDVLRELPRDFHFCSLGYSRPKTAPIVAYRKHVGIPTHLFYLTGYLISESGAEFLLNALPIQGPVDSWIGLKMTSNFDNVFGTVVGIGRSKPLADALANKDLCTILQFRAFCALQPLCTQRVGAARVASSSSGRSWRHRDTDIEYSGGKWNYTESNNTV